jgi:hypothetical protein
MKADRITFLAILSLAVSVSAISRPAQANTIIWQGHTWNLKSITSGGPGPNNWNPNNVFVDANGFLHLLITADPNSLNGFDCAELYTADTLGFGIYQWQIEARIDTFDPWVTLGLFPYGPPALGPNGTNEIDVEYSKWGVSGGNNGEFSIYPNSGTTAAHNAFNFALTGIYTTSRFTWSATGIQFWLLGGFQPIGTTQNVVATWNYAPADPSVSIPQRAMPLHMNLWLYQGHAPSNRQPVEVIIHYFTVALAEAPIQSWRMQYFGSLNNTGNAADTANPAGDGVPNLMKYALGMNPTVNSLTGLPATSGSTGFLKIQFNRNLSATDITYAVDASDDMKAWTPIALLSPGSSSWSLFGASVTDTSGAVTVVDQTAITGPPNRFLKLIVTGT